MQLPKYWVSWVETILELKFTKFLTKKNLKSHIFPLLFSLPLFYFHCPHIAPCPHWTHTAINRLFSSGSKRMFQNSPKCLRITPGTIKTKKSSFCILWANGVVHSIGNRFNKDFSVSLELHRNRNQFIFQENISPCVMQYFFRSFRGTWTKCQSRHKTGT